MLPISHSRSRSVSGTGQAKVETTLSSLSSSSSRRASDPAEPQLQALQQQPSSDGDITGALQDLKLAGKQRNMPNRESFENLQQLVADISGPPVGSFVVAPAPQPTRAHNLASTVTATGRGTALGAGGGGAGPSPKDNHANPLTQSHHPKKGSALATSEGESSSAPKKKALLSKLKIPPPSKKNPRGWDCQLPSVDAVAMSSPAILCTSGGTICGLRFQPEGSSAFACAFGKGSQEEGPTAQLHCCSYQGRPA